MHEGVYSKKGSKLLQYKSKASILRRKEYLKSLINHLETQAPPVCFDEGSSESDEHVLDQLVKKDIEITTLLNKGSPLTNDEIYTHLLLESISDSEAEEAQMQFDEKQRQDFINGNMSKFLSNLSCEPLNQMIKKLHQQERELDYEEELRENERLLREKKNQESLENDNEDSKNPSDPRILDWKDEITEEINEEFRQRCKDRLKKSNNLNWIAYSDRFHNSRSIKNLRTIRKPSKAWIECFAIMEAERYKNPTRPWLYYNPDGSTSIVAPVLRKMGQTTYKAREHNALKKDRPPYVTIL